jgi:hypothetical protein
MTKNHELFAKDPRSSSLPNEGVAKVKGGADAAVVGAELSMFVCEGQYAKGMTMVLETYVNNIEKQAQPATWISGFFGSGKSHLVKVLRHLWTNDKLSDGRTPREIASLPVEVKDLLKELDTHGRKCGGLFAAAGVLETMSPELIPRGIVSIVYEALGLPTNVGTAEFVLWMRRKGLESKVRADIEAANLDYDAELDHFRVSGDIATSLARREPALGKDPDDVLNKLNTQFPANVTVDIERMVKLIRQALSERFASKLPCTLLVIDEAQQSLGGDPDRTFEFEKCVEAITSRLDSRVMVVATGQSMLRAGTANLEKLQDRFTRHLHLQDNDIETVIRKVVLQKRPDRKSTLQAVIESSEGEITRQLQGTRIEAVPTDKERYVEDYPLLPVRQRFWEKVLRNIDTGLTGQLRTQLRITHEAVAKVADAPIGTVIAADTLFDQLAVGLIEKGVLDRDRHNRIQQLRTSSDPDDQLAGRLFALIYLIGRINSETRDTKADLGIRSTPTFLADLLVEDLKAGGASLRERIPVVLAAHEAKGALLLVGDEYRLQTLESAAWEERYQRNHRQLMGNDGEIGYLRSELIRTEMTQLLGDIALVQGKAKVRRQLTLGFFDTAPPLDQGVPIWIRSEWDVATKAAVAEANAGGVDHPRITILLPKTRHDELKQALAQAKAAEQTLQDHPPPQTAAGHEASKAIEHRKMLAQTKAREILLESVFKDAKVILAGSEDFNGITLTDKVRAACDASLRRLYPSFHLADSDKWEDIFKQAKAGAGSPLQSVNHQGDPDKHPVCKALLDEIGAGKKGVDLAKKFVAPPFGWPAGAINAGLMVLLAAGLLRATRNQQPVQRQALEQSGIGPVEFVVDQPPIAAGDKVKLRGLFQKIGVKCQSNDDVEIKAGDFLVALLANAQQAGGEPPLPESPNVSRVKELQTLFGNEQLTAILRAHDELLANIDAWSKRAELAKQRLPRWKVLLVLLEHAENGGLAEAAGVRSQVDAIGNERQLLDHTDPVPSLAATLATALRARLKELTENVAAVHEAQADAIANDPAWRELGDKRRESRDAIATANRLAPPREFSFDTEDDLINVLQMRSLPSWQELAAALPGQFDAARRAAAKELEPKAQSVKLPSATIRSKEDLAEWLASAEKSIADKLADGPVII